jgi:uncharacterized lipoprotein
MKSTLLTLAIAFALGALAGCDRNPAPAQRPAGTGTTAAPTTPQSNTPSTPANMSAPTQAEKRDGGQPPVQGREDVRQPEQRKDFEQKGDGAGPKPGG